MRLENSFIPVEGVGERSERRLWRAGITTWSAFGGDTVRGVGPTLADRIEAFIGAATERLDAGDAAFFERRLPGRERWRLIDDFRDRTAYLDIETTGLDRQWADVTVVGIRRDDTVRTLVRGRDLTAESLVGALAGVDLLVTFNGAQFDLPFLEAAFDLEVEAAHLDLRYPCRRLGLTGGLKAIERSVGVNRDRPDLSGRDAVRLWRQYERAGDEAALETLLDYNREDVTHLAALTDIVADRLHDRVFGAVAGSSTAGTATRSG